MNEKEKQAIVDKLCLILDGKLDPIHGRDIIAEDVILHMDDMGGGGFDMWYTWLRFIQSQGRIPDLGIDRKETRTHEDGTISIYGTWTGTLNGQPVTGNDATVRYRVEDGLIREIWTHRTNYILPMGWPMRWPVVWMLVGVRYSLWKRMPSQRSMRTT